MLEVFKLRHTYFGLVSRTKAFRTAKPTVTPSEAEGYEIQDAASAEKSSADSVTAKQIEGKKLKEDWTAWQDAVLTNA